MPLEIFFNTNEPVDVRNIAKSLLSLEQLAKRTPHLIERLSGVEIQGHHLKVRKIESGSLLQEVVLQFFLKEEQKQRLEEYLERHPKVKNTAAFSLGGLAIFLIVAEGIQAWNAVSGTNSKSIEDSYNTTITIAAENLDITPGELTSIIQDSTQNRKKMITHSLGVMSPVQGHDDASVGIGGEDSGMSIPEDAVQDIDFDHDLNSTVQEIPYEHAQLQVVSLHRENANSAWSGRLASAIGNTLLKIEIDDGVNLTDLSQSEFVYVDAIVTYRQDINAASLIPQSILVTKVYDESEDEERTEA